MLCIGDISFREAAGSYLEDSDSPRQRRAGQFLKKGPKAILSLILSCLSFLFDLAKAPVLHFNGFHPAINRN